MSDLDTRPVIESATVGVDGWCHTPCTPDHFFCGLPDPHPEEPPHDYEPPPWCHHCDLPVCPTCAEIDAAEVSVCLGCGLEWQLCDR